MADGRANPRKTNSSPIAQLRMAKGLTQAQLAEQVNVPTSAVSKWETGTVNPGMKSLAKLAAVLECSIDSLVNV